MAGHRPCRGVASAGAVGEGASEGPGAFAARELVSTLIRMGCRAPTLDEVGDAGPLIVLHQGKACPDLESGDRCRLPCFSWRASSSHVEIFGENGDALLRGAYDFLQALGARWVEPGAGASGCPAALSSDWPKPPAARRRRACDDLVLGHGAFLERWEDYLSWAARAGYPRSSFTRAPMRWPWEPRRGVSTRRCALR